MDKLPDVGLGAPSIVNKQEVADRLRTVLEEARKHERFEWFLLGAFSSTLTDLAGFDVWAEVKLLNDERFERDTGLCSRSAVLNGKYVQCHRQAGHSDSHFDGDSLKWES